MTRDEKWHQYTFDNCAILRLFVGKILKQGVENVTDSRKDRVSYSTVKVQH